MHVARGWRERSCPTCKALSGDPCRTPSGREACQPHAARLRPGCGELLARPGCVGGARAARRDVRGRPVLGPRGPGGKDGDDHLSRLDGDELVDVERWIGRDELAFALEAPVWDRYGQFVGQPGIRGRSRGRR